MSLKKGEIFTAPVESTAFKGKGVARHKGVAVFVSGTAPGDVAEMQVIRKKRRYVEARVLRLVEESEHRIEPVCRHANVCGGCTWQHLPYEKQLEYKEQHVRDHMERSGKLSPDLVRPILGCDQQLYYRNKMEYSFAMKRWLTEEEIRAEEYVDDTGFAAGLHAPGRFDKILNLSECHLQDPVSYQLLDFVRSYCITNDIPAFDTFKKEGFIRHLVIRNSFHTDDLMVNLVTYEDQPEVIGKLTESLLQEFPQITTVVNNINDQPNPTAVGRIEKVLYGPGFIIDKIGNLTFKIHANTFFQTNTQQAEKLYSVAREFCRGESIHHLMDLYCGVGTLSLYMADIVERVTGVEMVEPAIENARFNARENGITNAQFVTGDMKDTFNDAFLKEYGKPDCIITDPPRAGMHPSVVEKLCELAVNRLVYVSCNPSTMARDLEVLKSVYEVETIQPVDMFPQTYHIEAVAKLTRK